MRLAAILAAEMGPGHCLIPKRTACPTPSLTPEAPHLRVGRKNQELGA